MGRGFKKTFFKEDIDGQQAHDKMFNFTNYWGDANQNHNKILPHIC